MSEKTYKQYKRKQIAELADWSPDFDMDGVSVSDADKENGSPKAGDKVARNPKNHNDRWLVAEKYFADNFEPVDSPIPRPPLTGAEFIVHERERQMFKEGWTAEHDDEHEEEELAKVATMYAMPERYREYYDLYPRTWAVEWWKPEPENRIRELIKAGALIAAEIDRLQRQEVGK